jgi:hypothetical protein
VNSPARTAGSSPSFLSMAPIYEMLSDDPKLETPPKSGDNITLHLPKRNHAYPDGTYLPREYDDEQRGFSRGMMQNL